ncbi:MAG: type II toxin-antitoxin system RelB/DinJ family antitoxin [Clostridia bacterium]|nr:type II toxin-antitoxin system RelB/DinJ family antitoxin [Clostridia bacterium]
MAQSTFSVRMDEALKEEFDCLCRDFGMNASTAINIFARAVVRERRIPFEISAPDTTVTRAGALDAFEALRRQAKANGASDVSLEAINAEIALARKESDS